MQQHIAQLSTEQLAQAQRDLQAQQTEAASALVIQDFIALSKESQKSRIESFEVAGRLDEDADEHSVPVRSRQPQQLPSASQQPQQPQQSMSMTSRLPARSQVASSTSRRPQSASVSGSSGEELRTAEIPPMSAAARSAYLRDSSQLMQRMKLALTTAAEATNQTRLNKHSYDLFLLRRLCDEKREQVERMEKQLAELEKERAYLDHVHSAPTTVDSPELAALKMKLSTTQIKLSECEQLRHHYQVTIAHLKEEQIQNGLQLEHWKGSAATFTQTVAKLEAQKQRAVHDTAALHEQIAEFHRDQAEMQRFFSEQLDAFAAVQRIAADRERQRIEHRKSQHEQRSAAVQSRLEALSSETERTNQQSEAMSKQLASIHERLRYFEKKFQTVAAATGLTDPVLCFCFLGIPLLTLCLLRMRSSSSSVCARGFVLSYKRRSVINRLHCNNNSNSTYVLSLPFVPQVFLMSLCSRNSTRSWRTSVLIKSTHDGRSLRSKNQHCQQLMHQLLIVDQHRQLSIKTLLICTKPCSTFLMSSVRLFTLSSHRSKIIK